VVIDSSALAAILFREDDASTYAEAIAAALVRHVPAANLLEAAMVIEGRLGEAGGRELDALVARSGIAVVPVDADQVALARQAFRLYGKGRHAARLNFGDCFAYALAKATGEPLLFKGGDFALTDIASALA
jgi:ribonuclease VapC